MTLKKLLAGALAAVIMTAACGSSATAQVPETPNLKPKVYIGGGFSALTGPAALKDAFGTSLSFMLGVGLPISVGFEPMAKFHYHDYNLDGASQTLGFLDPNTKFLMYGVDGKFSIAPPLSPAKPYLVGGIGIFNIKQDATSQTVLGLPISTPQVSESDVYFNIGAGVDVKLGPTFAFFAEGKYTFAKSSGQTVGFLPILVGLRIL
ncbi:MAG: outer membrane beta-barrel protein [Candidatus Zixiibacteriota bacterium]